MGSNCCKKQVIRSSMLISTTHRPQAIGLFEHPESIKEPELGMITLQSQESIQDLNPPSFQQIELTSTSRFGKSADCLLTEHQEQAEFSQSSQLLSGQRQPKGILKKGQNSKNSLFNEEAKFVRFDASLKLISYQKPNRQLKRNKIISQAGIRIRKSQY